MRTDYRYDDFQQTYFVIDSYDELMEATYEDFAPIYARLPGMDELKPSDTVEGDRVYSKGTQEYARAGGLPAKAEAL
jgi:phenylalanine-4-hydroxylase